MWLGNRSFIYRLWPLANGATVILEGIPTHPSPSRFWEVIDKHKVNIFYTAPTALRALMAQGDDFVESSSRESLRILVLLVNPSIQKHGNGILKWSEIPLVL